MPDPEIVKRQKARLISKGVPPKEAGRRAMAIAGKIYWDGPEGFKNRHKLKPENRKKHESIWRVRGYYSSAPRRGKILIGQPTGKIVRLKTQVRVRA